MPSLVLLLVLAVVAAWEPDWKVRDLAAGKGVSLAGTTRGTTFWSRSVQGYLWAVGGFKEDAQALTSCELLDAAPNT